MCDSARQLAQLSPIPSLCALLRLTRAGTGPSPQGTGSRASGAQVAAPRPHAPPTNGSSPRGDECARANFRNEKLLRRKSRASPAGPSHCPVAIPLVRDFLPASPGARDLAGEASEKFVRTGTIETSSASQSGTSTQEPRSANMPLMYTNRSSPFNT